MLSYSRRFVEVFYFVAGVILPNWSQVVFFNFTCRNNISIFLIYMLSPNFCRLAFLLLWLKTILISLQSPNPYPSISLFDLFFVIYLINYWFAIAIFKFEIWTSNCLYIYICFISFTFPLGFYSSTDYFKSTTLFKFLSLFFFVIHYFCCIFFHTYLYFSYLFALLLKFLFIWVHFICFALFCFHYVFFQLRNINIHVNK